MNITDKPEHELTSPEILALADGPNGVATRVYIWVSKSDMEAGKPATLSLDFKNCDEVVTWFALNTQMVSKVRSLLKAKAAAGN